MADIYMRNIRDWRDATLMLTFEEKGYYDELLNLIYMFDDLLPDDDEFICRAMPIHSRTHQRLKNKMISEGLLAIKDGFYRNKRASLEVSKINQISDKNRKKAESRWSKLLKNNEMANAKAYAPADATAFAAAMQNKKDEEERLIKKIEKGSCNENERKFKRNRKCAIEDILDPDGEVPEDYRKFAEEEGLQNIDVTFQNWANWWIGEDGRKAGRRGWFATWKARVRKDARRQKQSFDNQHRSNSGHRKDTTTNGARLALNRRRNRKRKASLEK